MFSFLKSKPNIDQFAEGLLACTLVDVMMAVTGISSTDSSLPGKIHYSVRGVLDASLQIIVDDEILQLYGKDYFNTGIELTHRLFMELISENIPDVDFDGNSIPRAEGVEIMTKCGQTHFDNWRSGIGLGKALVFRRQLKNKLINCDTIQDYQSCISELQRNK
jgi:hypothetical protein